MSHLASKQNTCSNGDMRFDDLEQLSPEDRREVSPPIEVDVATWSAAGSLDWWVKERREWFGRVRGKDGRQKWIRATELRPAIDGREP
jgi:hypothetical protein